MNGRRDLSNRLRTLTYLYFVNVTKQADKMISKNCVSSFQWTSVGMAVDKSIHFNWTRRAPLASVAEHYVLRSRTAHVISLL